MTIVQPRLDNISEFEESVESLLSWGDKIHPVAQAAFNGEGMLSAGNHCQYCKVNATCRERSEFNTALEDFGFKKPPLLTNAEVGEILKRAINLKKWVADLEDYALSTLLQGGEIPNWKAVEGRSVRQFTDTEKAFETIIANDYDEALLYERKPITLTKIEALLGKAKFNELLSSYIEKPPGKPTLAEESDKREAITLKTTAAEDFNNDDDLPF